MADRAVVGHILELFPMLDGNAAAGLLFVEEGFHQQRSRQDLVARRVEQVGARHVGRADRLALAAAQAILDAAGNRADVALLHDQRFVAHQAEGRRVGIGQIRFHAGQVQQLALVEAAFGVYALLVFAEFADLVFGQEFQLGDADAVLARDHAIERAGQLHDARHGDVGILQHFVMVGIDRDVGVDVAVTGVHVQRHEDAATQHALVDGLAFFQDQLEGRAREDLAQLRAHFLLPGDTHGAVLHHVEDGGFGLVDQTLLEYRQHLFQAQCGQFALGFTQRLVQVGQQVGPARMGLLQQAFGLVDAVFQHLGGGDVVTLGVVALAQRQVALDEEAVQFGQQLQLVLDRQLDVDALDAVGVFAHAIERDHHVFVDLEGVGVLGNGGGTRAVQPEFLARFRAHGHEALAA